MQELKRRIASSKSWGIEPAELIAPAAGQGARAVHQRRTSSSAAFYSPERRRRRLARGRHADAQKRARSWARSRSAPGVEVTGIDIEGRPRHAGPHRPGRHRDRHRRHRLRHLEPADRADGRRVDPAHAGGPPDDRRRAGAALRGHVEARSATRSSATSTRTCTSASTATSFEVGSYAHRAILMDPDDIPSIAASALSPTSCRSPRTTSTPSSRTRSSCSRRSSATSASGMKLAINGLLSLTPDGNPILGETPEVKGLWSAAAIWIKEAPGHRQDRRRVDDQRRRPRSTRTARTSPGSTTTTGRRSTSPRARPRASTRPTASSTRWSSGRPTATSA